MRVDAFDFELPESSIATRPVSPRDRSRMLVVNDGERGSLQNRTFLDLESYLRPGDALVFNDTKVIPAQLEGLRTRGDSQAKIGLTLHMRMAPNRWRAFARGAKKIQQGDNLSFSAPLETGELYTLRATVTEKAAGGEIDCEFDHSGQQLDIALTKVGKIPLPPYIASKRPEDARDHEDYQTVYAKERGAVAAPTAGLHFTNDLLGRMRAKGVLCLAVTLHVGAGTFLPVKADDTEDHLMHEEIGSISEPISSALNQVRQSGGRLFAVGTTSLRLLESAVNNDGIIPKWSGATDIFITPGYKFKAVDALITNFHLPRSTLFMLVSAFAGTGTMKNAYNHAISDGYRFYSYGDSSLLFPEKPALNV